MATPSSSIELTQRGRVLAWLAALATGAAWIGGDDNARLAAAMLAAPLVVDFIAKQRRLHHTAVRVASRRTTAGAVFTETLIVEHAGRRPLRHCHIHEPRTMRGEPPVLLPTLDPFEPGRVQMRQRSLVRSHVIERVFVLKSEWPLGMFASHSIVNTSTDLITEPARVPINAHILDAATDAETAPVERSMLPGPEFVALREHQLDEDARGVHALRSASLGTLVRRVTRGRMPRTIGVILDLRRGPGQGRGRGLRRCEWSLAACASLVETLHGRGSELFIHLLAEEPARMAVRDSGQMAEFMTLLSEVSLSTHHHLDPDQLADMETLAHCYWIAAGGFTAAPEMRALRAGVTVVGGDE